VHDDLRKTNFIVLTNMPETIMLIDIDWGGEAGRVSFPTLTDEKRIKSLVNREYDIRDFTAALEGQRPVTVAVIHYVFVSDPCGASRSLQSKRRTVSWCGTTWSIC
jgi:hypothetical protein